MANVPCLYTLLRRMFWRRTSFPLFSGVSDVITESLMSRKAPDNRLQWTVRFAARASRAVPGACGVPGAKPSQDPGLPAPGTGSDPVC